MARILLGVSGGIAAYKALELIRLATGAGHSVRVVQTPTSRRFVGEASFAALSGAPVLTDEFEQDPARGAFPDQQPPAHQPLSHLQLVANADVYLIAPASANTLAKLAGGLADNLLSSCALAASCPVVVAPAMNNHMYEHPATQANIELLRARGVHIVEPDTGRLASLGEQGPGRLAEPRRLLSVCEQILAGDEKPEDLRSSSVPSGSLAAKDWSGLRVLVTAGGTREPIDSVRFLGNSSSGRMGLALAQAARRRGATVTLIAANVGLEAPSDVSVRPVCTAAELQAACDREFPECDVLLMAAAVADFRPAEPVDGKIKKGGRDRLTIELEPTADVLSGLSQRRSPGQTLVAFAAEHGPEALEHARAKLSAKGVDAVVFNDISRADIGFGSPANEVTILTGAGAREVPRATKESIADSILDTVDRLRTNP
ncbi:MAG TPA: bifunctional phosphopantothenoylcysteine decarboxylase/phosphopantothenate--cysteine ligase CoaBC [Solirubrobacteraceae bacterium]|jgi:phosphopantothenoylcysteine decarboxylase/phosphopantothenate--cysteine ligase|nr:bifunctional phosphopantothenoylcysteine decarboxylase/phosphopantothenate--cysteine ligase CoaBC [Solirubrobacteraceae bacterium]